MKISVITPSWNQGKFIRSCLESVKPAPGVTVEHIVLDNLSDDETAAILAEFEHRDDGVERRFISARDKGQTDAINRGFRMATGDAVCWLNTDERYHEGALAAVAAYFAAHDRADIVFGDCDFVDSSGALLKSRKAFYYSASMLLYYGCYVPSCSTFIRKGIIDSGHLLDPSYKVTMDFEYYVRLAKLGYRFEHMARTLADFTWHETNISTSFAKRRREERLQVQSLYSAIPGPKRLRIALFGMLRYYWMGRRLVDRMAVRA